MHLMERKTGVGTGGRGCGGVVLGECGQSSSFTFSAGLKGRGDRHLFREHFHALARSIEWEGLVDVLCVRVWRAVLYRMGAAVGGSVKTPKFVAIHAFIMESNEARKCPSGTTRQTSHTHTHAESWLWCSHLHYTLSLTSLGHLIEMFFMVLKTFGSEGVRLNIYQDILMGIRNYFTRWLVRMSLYNMIISCHCFFLIIMFYYNSHQTNSYEIAIL